MRRTDVRDYTAKANLSPRPDSDIVRRVAHEASVRYVTDREDRWESYRVNGKPLGVQFESGDTLEVELNRADLPQGRFSEDVYALHVDLNASSDFAVRSLVQYDTDSRLLGSNTRLRWTVTPEQEIACVLDYNALREDGPHLRSESGAVVIKAQHTFRF